MRCRLFCCVWEGTQLTLSYLESSNERENEKDGEDEKARIINGAIFRLKHDLDSVFSVAALMGIEFPSIRYLGIKSMGIRFLLM